MSECLKINDADVIDEYQVTGAYNKIINKKKRNVVYSTDFSGLPTVGSYRRMMLNSRPC